MTSVVDSPVLAALTAARRLVQEADLDLTGLRRRIALLADATAWQSSAADAYRAGIAALEGDLARVLGLIGLTDDSIARAQHDETVRVMAGW